MNRRGFLGALAAAFAAPVVAKLADVIPVTEAAPEKSYAFRFIESQEYGMAVSVSARGKSLPELVDLTKDVLLRDARRYLPKGTRFCVIDGGECDYGFVQQFAWLYSPKGYSGREIVCEAIA